eukprot:2275353-Amphidinium_carterae.1
MAMVSCAVVLHCNMAEVSTVAEIVLREFLGYTVRSIQHSQYEVSHVEDMYNGRVDLDMDRTERSKLRECDPSHEHHCY